MIADFICSSKGDSTDKTWEVEKHSINVKYVWGTVSSYLVFMNFSCRNFADESGMFQDATGIPSEKQLDLYRTA